MSTEQRRLLEAFIVAARMATSPASKRLASDFIAIRASQTVALSQVSDARSVIAGTRSATIESDQHGKGHRS